MDSQSKEANQKTAGVTGASGFIGRAVIDELTGHGYGAIGYSRSPERELPRCREVRVFPSDSLPVLTGLDAIIHLAGSSVFGLWTPGKKKEIMASRVETTNRIVEALAAAEPGDRPAVLACASGVGVYGDRGDEICREDSEAGEGFLVEVVKKWEAAALQAEQLGVRVVLLRIGFVLGKDGGAIPVMRSFFQKCLGGRLGNGKQWMPWIHIDDVSAIVRFCLENESIRGPVNLAAPEAVTNREFTGFLSRALGRPAFFHAPGPVLKCLPGGMGEMFLSSLRVEPAVLKSHDYPWLHLDCKEAIGSVL